MLANRYALAFAGGYTEVFGTSQAIADIATIEKLTAGSSGGDFGLPHRG